MNRPNTVGPFQECRQCGTRLSYYHAEWPEELPSHCSQECRDAEDTRIAMAEPVCEECEGDGYDRIYSGGTYAIDPEAPCTMCMGTGKS